MVGVGNPLRGDDGVGLYLAERLRELTPWPTISAEQAPENFTNRIADLRPDVVLITDAGDWGGEPGELRVLTDIQLASGMLSTHGPSLRLFAHFLKECLGVRVWILAVQVRDTRSGHPLSADVKAPSDAAATMLAAVAQ